MDRNTIRKEALRKIRLIEDEFGIDPPPEVVELHRALVAIALGDLSAYVDRVGPVEIDAELVVRGAKRLRWPPPSRFELDAIRLVNERVARESGNVIAAVFRR